MVHIFILIAMWCSRDIRVECATTTYTLATSGSTECPNGFQIIQTQDECEGEVFAAKQYGATATDSTKTFGTRTWGGAGWGTDQTCGCTRHTNEAIYFTTEKRCCGTNLDAKTWQVVCVKCPTGGCSAATNACSSTSGTTTPGQIGRASCRERV